ncbi:MAG: protein kinase domain-containing protein, partial [Gemmataceae bacterium]
MGFDSVVIVHGSYVVPKITDFGLARRPVEGDASDAELQGEQPCYLAPEQAWGRVKDIGPTTDIYALGAILYELIAGWPPFREATATETLDAIQCREPPSLSRLRSGVPSDLDAICRKCMAKQPRRRYASALDLAEDLRRCADGHPIKARTAGNAERLGKWLRRNARGVALVLLGLCLGAALMGLIKGGHKSSAPPPARELSYRQISRLESDLLEARRQKTNADYLRYLLLAERAADGRDKERCLEMLERCPAEKRHWEWYYLRGRFRDANQVSRFTTDLPITCMDISQDGQYLAVGEGMERPNEAGASKGEVSVWDLATRQGQWHLHMAEPVRSVAFSPDNTCVALIRGSQQRGRKTTLEARYVQTGVAAFAPRLFTDCTPTSLSYSADSRNLLMIADDG